MGLRGSTSEAKLHGAKGATALAILEQEFLDKPWLVWEAIEKAWGRILGADYPGKGRFFRHEEFCGEANCADVNISAECVCELLRERYVSANKPS